VIYSLLLEKLSHAILFIPRSAISHNVCTLNITMENCQAVMSPSETFFIDIIIAI